MGVQHRELAIDHKLDAKVEKEGTYTSQLSWPDRLKLRAIVRKVHMQHYPTEHCTDKEADRIIEAMGPETERYLLERLWEKVK
jgi:hypothetical protein